MLLGAHMSIAGGVHKAIERAESIGCTAVQLFTANARGWAGRAIPDSEARAFKDAAKSFGPDAILAHDGYLINLAAPKDDVYRKSVKGFAEEVDRCEQLGIRFLVMHPGAALDSPVEDALGKVADSFNRIFDKRKDAKVKVLIETTAGQGSTLGATFEQIAAILAKVDRPELFGVCVDTCHIFAAGYDISNCKGWLATWREFDRTIGLDKLAAFHVNDSKKELGSRVDRHEQIGKGKLGLEAFRLLVNDRRFKKIPLSLETPKAETLEEDVENMRILRSLVGKKSIALEM